ncbi:MAG: cobalamin biosynthesis protein [Candidatus Hodgkinia cicadicola]
MAMAFEWFVLSKLNWSLLAHPISVCAHAIEWLLRTKCKHTSLYGMVLNCVFTAAGAVLGCSLRKVLRANLLGQAFEVVIVASLFAHNSLLMHIDGVLDRIYNTELSVSRYKLALIVGRRVDCATEHEVCAMAILSLIENFCDATFSPLLYYLFLGLPGLLVYKIVELADSVYGDHKPENRTLGEWVAAYDNILNYIPSRLLALLLLITLYALNLGKYNVIAACNDGYSPVCINNALSESAIALHLNIRLNSDRRYNSVLIKDRQFNANGRLANGIDVKNTQYIVNVVYLITMILIVLLLF